MIDCKTSAQYNLFLSMYESQNNYKFGHEYPIDSTSASSFLYPDSHLYYCKEECKLVNDFEELKLYESQLIKNEIF